MKRLTKQEKQEKEFLEGSRDKVMFEETDNKDTSPTTDTVTGTGTVTGTLLEAKPVELMNRHVCYLTKIQSDYVRKMAKKHKVKESEIIRIAINLLMKG